MSAAHGEVPDYVVVGAGSAGCVVARRLVEGGATVALLEAGGPATEPAIHDPNRWPELSGGAIDWGYVTEPQEDCAGRRLRWPRGRVLGGSGAMNGMAYIRGHRLDYDGWAFHGCPGWSWEDVLPVFRRSEDFDGGASELRGAGGPFRVMLDYEPHPLIRAAVEATVQAGVPFNPDHNGPELDGVGYSQLTVRDGRRETSASAFLDPVAGDPRLEVVTGAHARRLVLEGGRCVGVEVLRDGELSVLRAAVEVIVCAGAIGSPQLLMLSGLGRAEELGQVGIDPVVDLRGVGRNLQDHLLVPVVVAATQDIGPPLPGLQHHHAHMFVRSRPGLVVPDTQPLIFQIPLYGESWMTGPANAFSLMAGLLRPASHGTVRLRSAQPSDPPIMDPRYLSAQADVDALESSVALMREIARQDALAPWAGAELHPGPSVTTSAEVRDYIRRTVGSYHHQSGTCRMGSDEDAVVDPRLRVRGVDGLRVADASIMPWVTTGNTNAPTIMIGERAADFALADAGAAGAARDVVASKG